MPPTHAFPIAVVREGEESASTCRQEMLEMLANEITGVT